MDALIFQHSKQDSIVGAPIIQAHFEVGGFTRIWEHCAQMADYLARFSSAGKKDPDRFANTMSAVLNTLLETCFRHNAGDGEITFTLSVRDHVYVLELTIPVGEANLDFYTEAMRIMEQKDLHRLYTDELINLSRKEVHPAIGFIELVALYNATVNFETAKNQWKISILIHSETLNTLNKLDDQK